MWMKICGNTVMIFLLVMGEVRTVVVKGRPACMIVNDLTAR